MGPIPSHAVLYSQLGGVKSPARGLRLHTKEAENYYNGRMVPIVTRGRAGVEVGPQQEETNTCNGRPDGGYFSESVSNGTRMEDTAPPPARDILSQPSLYPIQQALLEYTKQGRVDDVVEVLTAHSELVFQLSSVALVDGTVVEGCSLAHVAAWFGHAPLLNRLLSSFGTTLISGKDGSLGYTVAHIAAHIGNPRVFEVVVTCAPWLLFSTDNYGWCPLHVAAARGHAFALDLGLSHCRQPNNAHIDAEEVALLPNEDGETALDLAISLGHFGCVHVLAQHVGRDSPLWWPEGSPFNCLHVAVASHQPVILAFLLWYLGHSFAQRECNVEGYVTPLAHALAASRTIVHVLGDSPFRLRMCAAILLVMCGTGSGEDEWVCPSK